MLPVPSRAAVAAFVGLAAMLAIGIVATSAPVVILSSTGFVGLAWALAATMPEGRRLRRLRLEFAWWLDHGSGAASGAAVPGAPFDVRCYVRHRGARPLDVVTLEPLLPAGATMVERPGALRFAAQARTEFKVKMEAPAAGRVVLHGLALTVRGPLGLFATPLYFPNPLTIKVLPRAAAGRSSSPGAPRAATMERSGRTQVRRRGGGTELHELRDFVPGDPFKAIAWKASARRGKLLVKEVEQEVQETRWLVLDVSGTMRGGELGARKLDFAIEAAAAEARRALDAGDRVGLMAFDGRIVGHVPPGEGRTHQIRIYDALLALTELVDEDLTDLDDATLTRLVCRYVRQQDGVDFAAGRGGPIDVGGLVGHVRRSLDGGERKGPKVLASNPTAELFRRFCRERGLRLPYRPAPGDHAKAHALANVLQALGARSRVDVVVITDFDGIADPEALRRPLKLVRARGHGLAFVLPDGRTFAPDATGKVAPTLARIYAHNETRRLRDARRLLGRLGVPALIARRGDAPGLVATRARRARRAA